MKKPIALASLSLVFALTLSSCSKAPASSEAEPSSVPASQAESVSQQSVNSVSQQTVSSASARQEEPASVSTSAAPSESRPTVLSKYETLDAIPGVDCSLSEDGLIAFDGTPMLAPPGPAKFVEPAFADSNYLYVRAVWPDDSFQWYRTSWDDLQDFGAIEGSHEKLFVQVDRTRLICDTGEAYDTATAEWVN